MEGAGSQTGRAGLRQWCRGLRVSVVGGSIGGLAAAIALHNAGANVKVLERRSVMLDEGAGIALRPDGVEGLARLGLNLPKTPEWSWRYGSVRDGNVKVRVEWRTSLTAFTYSRLRGMLSEAAVGIDYRPNSRVVSIADYADHPRLQLEGGAEIESDLVVAADGIDSQTRNSLFPSVQPQDTGITLLRGFVRKEVVERIFPLSVLQKFERGNTQMFASSPKGGWWLGHLLPDLGAGRMFQWIFYLPTNADEQKEFLTDADGVTQRWSTKAEKTSTAAKRKLRETFESYYPKKLVPLADAGAIMVHRNVKLLVPSMTEDRVCLVGDAAHVAPPWATSGASLAIADGVALADQLNAARSVEEGLAAWNNQRLEAARAMLALADKIQNNTLTHPPELVSATAEEAKAWMESIIAPGMPVTVFDVVAQPPIFDS